MPAGLTIYNDSGTVQIDESWENYGFRQVIDVPLSITNPPQEYITYSLVTPGADVLVACRAEGLRPVMMRSYFDGTNFTYNWAFFPRFIGETFSETVRFYVFDLMTGTYSNVGLEVFNASGNRVYHSDAGLMKVRDRLPGNVGFTGVSGRSYVPLIERNPVYAFDLGFPFGYRTASHSLRVSGSNITTDSVGGAGWGATGPYANNGSYAVIDVTGL